MSLALIIFGITGNLTQKYLIPALYDMEEKGSIPQNMKIIGIARKAMTKDKLEEYINQVLHQENIHHKHDIKTEVFKKLFSRIQYKKGDLNDPQLYLALKSSLQADNRIFYLATYPDLYQEVFNNLQKTGLSKQDHGWARVMVEKPIGTDLQSAKQINNLLGSYFSEDQIYRLDHYLAKETLQNILTFRFGNGIFEPLINKDYIDHIQITAIEDFGIGKRGGYYDNVGALKDVGQNHQLQMLAFATMDAPSQFSNQAVTKQRIKVLKSLVADTKKIIFGQYQGYKDEENVNPNSITDTFYALKTYLNNDRFKGVPIYIRGGKKLKQTATEISIVFKQPINRLFSHLDSGDQPNILIYRIAPNEGIILKILTKKPGQKIELEPEYMQFCYHQNPSGHYLPDPYERILLDAIEGDQTFFNDAAEIEAQWEFIDSLTNLRDKPLIYQSGTWGPKEAQKLIEEDSRYWLPPSLEYCNF